MTILGIYFKLQSFVFMPIYGLMQGGMPIISYNYGGENKERVIKTLKYCVLISMVIMITGAIIFSSIPHILLSMFNPSDELYEEGIKALRIICISFIPAGIIVVIMNMFQAIGKGFRSMIISFLRQLIFLVPIAHILSNIHLEAVWYAFPIAEGLALIVSTLMLIAVMKKDIGKLHNEIQLIK